MKNKNSLIGFIGAGRVGVTLGRYFFEKNLKISGYFSKTYEHACEAAKFTNSKSYKSIKELVAESQIIFITVPDSCIYDVYSKLKDYELKDKILCHCSGAMSAEVFSEIEQTGAYGYSVHPIFAIHDKENSYKEISKAFFTIEGNSEKMPIITEIFKVLGNPVQIIQAENKIKYHASLVTASNLVIGLYHIALGLLEECGFSYLSASEVLNPLFLNNAENICKNGCMDSLTGPVDRNDITTVNKHISALTESDDTLAVYSLLSKELIKVAKEKYPNRDYENIERLLSEL